MTNIRFRIDHSLTLAPPRSRRCCVVAAGLGCLILTTLLACGSDTTEPATDANLAVNAVSVSPAAALPGQPVTVKVTVTNAGSDTAKASTALLSFGSSRTNRDEGAAAAGSVSLPVLYPGDSYTVAKQLTVPSTAAPGLTFVWALLPNGSATYGRGSAAFEVTSASLKFAVTDLGAAVGDSLHAIDLNDAGQIVGTAYSAGISRNVLWADGQVADLGTCSPVGINDPGTVACRAGATWTAGQTSSLGLPGGYVLSAINDSGEVAGFGSGSSCAYGCAFVSGGGKTALIAVSEEASESCHFAKALIVPRMHTTTHGMAVGNTCYHSGPALTLWLPDSTAIPLKCRADYYSGQVNALGGADDRMAGWGSAPLGPSVGLVCSATGTSQLDSLATAANDVSRKGLVVGGTLDNHGFLYAGGVLEVLNDALTASGWNVVSADLVNDTGEIVATGINTSTGRRTTLLLSLVK